MRVYDQPEASDKPDNGGGGGEEPEMDIIDSMTDIKFFCLFSVHFERLENGSAVAACSP